MEELKKFIKSKADGREILRAIAVKMAKEGIKYKEINEIIGISEAYVSKWKSRYEEEGIKGLKLGHKGFKPYLEKEQKQEIIDKLKQTNYWNLEELIKNIKEKYKVEYKSLQSYYDLFDEAGISWKKSQKTNPKKDKEKVEAKKKEIIKVVENKEAEVEIYLIDESHLIYNNICGYVWGKKQERVKLKISNPNEKTTFYGGLNYRTKEFVVKQYSEANSRNTVLFLEHLHMINPEKRLIIICDNASFHKHGEIPDYLNLVNKDCDSKKTEIELIYFAPNAPEQNPVEDIWLLAKTFIRKHYYLVQSFSDLSSLFFDFLKGKSFSFPKVFLYG